MSDTDTAGNPVQRPAAYCGRCGGPTNTGGRCVTYCGDVQGTAITGRVCGVTGCAIPAPHGHGSSSGATVECSSCAALRAQVAELTRERDGLMNACDKLEDKARRAWDDGHMAGREKSPTLQENRELRERAEQAEAKLAHVRAALDEAVAACEQREADHRRDLWISHGHTAALYGDDGEMQCTVPPFACDFKRDPLPRLVNHVRAALAEAVAEERKRCADIAADTSARIRLRIVTASVMQPRITAIGEIRMKE